MGRAADGGDCRAIARRPRAGFGATTADISGTARPPRVPAWDGVHRVARHLADRDHADRGGNRARLDVRPALSRFSIRFANDGGGALCAPDATQSPAGRCEPDCRVCFCRTVRGGGALYRLQRRSRKLAIAVDLRDLFPAGAYAVAGAGRAKPKISRPIASPDSTTL